MKWIDRGILIAISKFQETDQLASFITENHGLARGLVKGGLSKKQKPYLQIGNEFDIIWKSRLEEQLGFFAFEPVKIYGLALFDKAVKLELLSCCCSLLYDGLTENTPNKNVYLLTLNFIHNLEVVDDKLKLLYEYMNWEKKLLAELGFALTLDKCNATGTTENLSYISTKTGHAICESAGEPYRKRLLCMPKIWKRGYDLDGMTTDDVIEALKILEYFFEKRIYSEKNKDIPFTRRNLGK